MNVYCWSKSFIPQEKNFKIFLNVNRIWLMALSNQWSNSARVSWLHWPWHSEHRRRIQPDKIWCRCRPALWSLKRKRKQHPKVIIFSINKCAWICLHAIRMGVIFWTSTLTSFSTSSSPNVLPFCEQGILNVTHFSRKSIINVAQNCLASAEEITSTAFFFVCIK